VKSGERTAVSVVECNEVFKEMETEARFIKKHFLLLPPLMLVDLPTLLLPLPDDTHTPVPPPTGQPALTITYPGGPHLLMVHLAPLPGTEPSDSRGDYGYALYRGIMPQGGATLEQAASLKHYLMKEPLSGDVPKSRVLFGLGVCAMRKLHATNPLPAGRKNWWILTLPNPA
jgi:hypothetical protein